MQIGAGKRYKTRDGRAAKVAEFQPGLLCGWQGHIASLRGEEPSRPWSWTAEGRSFPDEESPSDIVAEWDDGPQPPPEDPDAILVVRGERATLELFATGARAAGFKAQVL